MSMDSDRQFEKQMKAFAGELAELIERTVDDRGLSKFEISAALLMAGSAFHLYDVSVSSAKAETERKMAIHKMSLVARFPTWGVRLANAADVIDQALAMSRRSEMGLGPSPSDPEKEGHG